MRRFLLSLLLGGCTVPTNPNNPLAAAFAEIDAQARRAQLRVAPPAMMTVEAPAVGPDEQALISGLMAPESDLERASALAQVASKATTGGSSPNLSLIQVAASKGNIGTSIAFVDRQQGIAALTPLLQVQADDGKASVFTVALQSWPVPTAPIAPHPDPVLNTQLVCVVDYGAGGVQNRVEFDYVDGTVFEVPGSFVRVSVYARTGVTGVTSPPPFMVGAFIVNRVGVRTTRLLDTLAPITNIAHGGGASPEIPIPANASAVQVTYVGSEAATVNPVIQTFGIGGTPQYSQSVAPGAPMALLGSACFVKVVNNDPAVDMAGALISFTIEL
jgi:hypothetical protein